MTLNWMIFRFQLMLAFFSEATGAVLADAPMVSTNTAEIFLGSNNSFDNAVVDQIMSKYDKPKSALEYPLCSHKLYDQCPLTLHVIILASGMI